METKCDNCRYSGFITGRNGPCDSCFDPDYSNFEPIPSPSIHEPDPIKGDKIVLDLVMQDLKDRAEMGKEKYGTYLMTNNGRNALMDAYQEALDLVMYFRQLIEETKK